MEARRRSSSEGCCNKHPQHRQSPGICSLCLRERLSKISSASSSRAVVSNVSSSSSSSSISSVSSAYSSHASSCTASPMQSYRNRRKIDNFEGNGYLHFLRKNANGVLKKSRSVAFVSDQNMNVMQDHEKKLGFWSKLMGAKRSSSRMMHSRTMRETFH